MEKHISLYQREETVEIQSTTTYDDFLTTIKEKFNLKEKSFYVKNLTEEDFDKIIYEQNYFEIERSEYDKAKERLNGKSSFKYIKTLQEAEDFLTVYGFDADKHGKTPLHWAIIDYNLLLVEFLLSKNFPNIHKADRAKITPLNWAAIKGNKKIFELILEQDFDNNYDVDQYNRTALFCAISTEHLDIVKLILEKNNPVINKADLNGITPFYFAVFKDNIEIVKLFLAKNIENVNRADNNGMTPFYIAVKNGNLEMVKLLLEQNFPNAHDLTPIIEVVLRKDTEIIKLLEADIEKRKSTE